MTRDFLFGKQFSWALAAMQGIEAHTDAGVLDIGAVMAAQGDLVMIRHRLRQVVNVKG